MCDYPAEGGVVVGASRNRGRGRERAEEEEKGGAS